MASIKFVEGFQQTLNSDYINTLKEIPSWRNKLSKALEKYVEQLPSLSRKPYQNVMKVLFQLDTYDQVSPSLYHHNAILEQILILFHIILETDGDFAVNNTNAKSSIYKLNNNSSGNLLSKAKKHSFSYPDCALMFKVFNTNFLRKFCIEERDLDYCKEINKILTILARFIEKDNINDIVFKCIFANARAFVIESYEEDDDVAEQISINKNLLNKLITTLIDHNEIKTALKVLVEAKIDLNKDKREFIKKQVIGCKEKSFDINVFNFMKRCKYNHLFEDIITKSILENRLLNYIIWFNNDMFKQINFERLNLIFEMLSYLKNTEDFDTSIKNGLKLLKASFEHYLKANEQISKTSSCKLIDLIISEISIIEKEPMFDDLQQSNENEYIEPDYTLWSQRWESAILERLSTSKDEEFIQWVSNNTDLITTTDKNFQSEFDYYIFKKFKKQVPTKTSSLNLKTFTLAKDIKKRLVIHNMGMLLATELFEIKYLINEQAKTINFIVKYKLNDDSIDKNMLDFSCRDDSGLLHTIDVNSVKILRVQDWSKYLDHKTTLRFKILMNSGKKYVFDVEFYLYLNKLFTKHEDLDLESFECEWNHQSNKMAQKIDINYDKFVIHLSKLKKYNVQVLNKSNDCFYVAASLQTIDLQQVDILSVMKLNNQLSWDIELTNNIADTTVSEIINKSFIEIFKNI